MRRGLALVPVRMRAVMVIAGIIGILVCFQSKLLGDTTTASHNTLPPPINLSAINGGHMLELLAPSSEQKVKYVTTTRPTRRLFVKRPLKLWSTDFHIGPIGDLKHLLEPLGVEFIDQSLSGHCLLTKTCAINLHVLNRQNGLELDSRTAARFYDHYKDDPVIQSVDAFVCFHPTAMCELYLPFNKSLIVIASTRYEMGRESPRPWQHWNENLVKISRDSRHVIGGNNLYDIEYLKYFTGIDNVLYLPSYCGYTNATYRPTKSSFLLAPIHSGTFNTFFTNALNETCVKQVCSEVTLEPLRRLYPRYQYTDLAAHKGIVHVPYQVSVMSLFEQYRMSIPLFFPTPRLLFQWNAGFWIMAERTWAGVNRRRKPSGSPISGHESHQDDPDPNNDVDEGAFLHWIKFADFYQLPHIVYYDSFDDLVERMKTTNLADVSSRMRRYNDELETMLVDRWSGILMNIARSSPNHPH